VSSNSVFPPASETVLVVENETAIRNLVQMALERHGYHILAAEILDRSRDPMPSASTQPPTTS